jgi:hypothetical protein
MTPKEKAKELYDKFNDYPLTHEWKKQCALIAINEMINICYNHHMASYYGMVKQEIENL